MRNFAIPMLLICACLYPDMVRAADCQLKMVNTIPVALGENGARVLVPVIINGTKETFMLDTGGALTQISVSAAHGLDLPIGESSVKMLDLYGQAAVGAAHVKTLGLGRLQDRDTTLPVMTSTFEGEQYVGILAPDYMGEYDVELDISGGKMNYFSQDHCPGKVVYWPAAAIAEVPMRFVNNHLILDVILDGHPFRAMIDTGAPVTTLVSAEAKRVFGLAAEDQDKRFEHTFQKLSFEGLEVSNPHIAVIPDKTGSKDPNNDYVTGTRVRRVDDPDSSEPAMLIGLNILSKLRLYIAFDEKKIYITPASPPPAASATPATSAP